MGLLQKVPGAPFFVIGGLWGVGALAHPCPTCVAGSLGCLARGAMEHVDAARRWMDRTFATGE